MKCYGRLFGSLKECRGCPNRRYCRDAADLPPLLREQSVESETVDDLPSAGPQPPELADPPEPVEQKVYSRQDLLEVIVFMSRLDMGTLAFLDEKIQHPEFGYSDLARRRNISRQAVHKFIRQRCRKIPELRVVLQRAEAKSHLSTTFLEEVCKIRQKRRATPSKKQKADLNCLRRLTCSIRSLDLSRTSMFRGGSILRSVSGR